MTAPVSHNTPMIATALQTRATDGNSSAYHSSAVVPSTARVICAAANARAAVASGGSKVRTDPTSKAGFCQATPCAPAGCQPGGFSQIRSLSDQRSACHDLRARSA